MGTDRKRWWLGAGGKALSTHEIQEHLQQIYTVELSAMLISNTTEAVFEEVKLWKR